MKAGYRSAGWQELLGHPLNDIEERNAPERVFYSGALGIPLRHPRVAVIGTRTPSERGMSEAKDVVETLVKSGITIVSGLARGIDTLAHKTAIRNGGRTVAVIGTPLDKSYPKENAGLQEEMMKHHMVISQYPAGHATTRKDFVLRNRTMALISNASIIIEAGEGSGTLHHGWEALRLGRPLYLCKSILDNQELEWPKEMTRYGAIVLDDTRDILMDIPSDDRMPELLR